MEATQNQPKPKKHFNAILITFTVLILATFFGIQLIMRSGLFHHDPGQIIFGDTLTEENIDFINNNIPDVNTLELSSNVTINRYESPTYNISYSYPNSANITEDQSNAFYASLVYDVLLPVTTFNDPTIDISHNEIENYQLVSIWNLEPSNKLLSLDNVYYLDFNSHQPTNDGAIFPFLEISGQQNDTEKIKDLLSSHIADLPTSENILTLAQTGVTALARRMTTKLNSVGNANYFAEKIGPFLSQFDFTHTSNESSFSTGANGNNICSQPAMIDTLTAIGLDVVELTGNHNQDCGDQDAINTIKKYQELGIKTYGGGISADEAAIPLEISAKDTNITMLAYNLSTGGYTLDNTPGANFYTDTKVKSDIAEAKSRGDFIIVDIQYYECNEYVYTSENTTCDYANSSAGNQIELFRSIIDMGANVVVGTAAHQPQTFEQYHDGEIYYGLGNLFFDQSDWPGTTRSLILVHYFLDGGLIQTRIVPTIYDANLQTEIMPTTEATTFLARLIQAQPKDT